MDILVSIPTHEASLCVRDQIENARKFISNHRLFFVIHASLDARENYLSELKTDILSLENTVINPTRFPTSHPIDKVTNLSSIHISNYNHALEAFGKFDLITMQNSNDLMVRHGLEFGIAGTLKHIAVPGEFRHNGYLSDVKFTNMMKDVGAKDIYFGWTEGSYYKTELFDEISKIITKHGINDKDEGAFQTALFSTHPELLDKVKPSYTYISPSINHGHIYEVQAGKHEGIYAVKRVNRDINDPIRRYIKTL